MRHLDTTSLIGKEYQLNGLQYRIEKEIGAGGVGVVYKATNFEEGQSICLKVLNPLTHFDYDRLVDRFYREARIAKELLHENLIKIYDVGKFFNHHHYSMEFCSGGNLKTFLRKESNIAFGRKWEIFKQICSGLNSIHESGYVHRDLKPDNIMIKTGSFILDDIKIKLSDFGTLLNVEDIADNPHTYPKDLIGSLIYISPEQRQGRDVNRQSDIFSLGILFYQLLIEDTYEYRLKLDESYKGLDYDGKFALQTVINRMCENDVRFRYKSLSDVFMDIKQKIAALDSYPLQKLAFPDWAKQTEKSLDIDFPSSNLYHSTRYSVHRYDEDLWRFPPWNDDDESIDDELYDFPTEAIISNGTVFAGWNSGYITSLSLYSGKLNWSMKLSDEEIYSTPICQEGKLYVVNKSGHLFCIEIYAEKILWKTDLEDDCSCPLKIINNYIYVVSNGGKIYVIDKADGSLKYTWEFTRTYGERPFRVHNIITFDNSLIFSHQDYIYGYPDVARVRDGKSYNWFCYAPNEVRILSSNSISGLAYDGKSLFATTVFGMVLCIDPKTGDGIWKIDTGEDIFSPPSVFEDFITFITSTGYLYVCDKTNGTMLKRRFVGESRSYTYSRDDEDYVTAIMSEDTILIMYKYCLKLLDKTSYKDIFGWEIGEEPRPCPTFSKNIIITSSTYGLTAFHQKKS